MSFIAGQHNRRLSIMLALAVIAHGLGLLVVLPEMASNHRVEREQIRLFRPLIKPPSENPEPVQTSQATPSGTREPIADSIEDEKEEVNRDFVEEPLSAQQLIQQTLLQAGASLPSRPPEHSIVDGKPVPRLPGASGWLNNFVGSVNPAQDTWLEADGASTARIVSAYGQIYCGRRRAPSAAEEFNPWMSAALMLWQSCGRQRPEPVDAQDPWQRGGIQP